MLWINFLPIRTVKPVSKVEGVKVSEDYELSHHPGSRSLSEERERCINQFRWMLRPVVSAGRMSPTYQALVDTLGEIAANNPRFRDDLLARLAVRSCQPTGGTNQTDITDAIVG